MDESAGTSPDVSGAVADAPKSAAASPTPTDAAGEQSSVGASLLPFHLAFPVTDLAATRRFYVDLLGCELGRSGKRWIDLNFFGHQITAHVVDIDDADEDRAGSAATLESGVDDAFAAAGGVMAAADEVAQAASQVGKEVAGAAAPVDSETAGTAVGHNEVDNKAVPIPHFGAVLSWADWHELSARLKAAGVVFLIGPYIRFAGEPGEQATMFLCDPSGNHLEFKSLKDPDGLFQVALAQD